MGDDTFAVLKAKVSDFDLDSENTFNLGYFYFSTYVEPTEVAVTGIT